MGWVAKGLGFRIGGLGKGETCKVRRGLGFMIWVVKGKFGR
jgi:hypothetical protein